MIKKFLILNLFLFSFLLTNSYSDNNTYMSLKNKKVNVRYGPGLDYPIKFVFNKKNYPVEIIDQKENFRKILDFKKFGLYFSYTSVIGDPVTYILLG